jgi:AcrR family transcriptional regulator
MYRSNSGSSSIKSHLLLEEVRTSLLGAVEHLFQQRGVSRRSLQDIASAAGVTQGAVYWHFQDKADPFNAMMDRLRLLIEAANQQLEACAAHDPLRRLREMLVSTLLHVATDPQVHRVFKIATLKVEFVDELQGPQRRRLQAVQEHQATLARCLQRCGLGRRTRARPARAGGRPDPDLDAGPQRLRPAHHQRGGDRRPVGWPGQSGPDQAEASLKALARPRWDTSGLFCRPEPPCRCQVLRPRSPSLSRCTTSR